MAKTVIGELATLITARTAPFEKGMKRARMEIKDFRGRVTAMGSNLLNLNQAMELAGRALDFYRRGLATVHTELQRIDTITKKARTLNLEFGDLEALRLASEKSGVSFELLSRGLQRMQRTIGQFGSERVRGMSVVEQLAHVSELIQDLPTHVERAAAAQDVFGRSGADLVNVLDSLSVEGLAKARAEANLFGKSLTGLETSAVEQLNDTFKDLREIIASIQTGVVVELTAAFQDLADVLKLITTVYGPGTIGRILAAVGKGLTLGPVGGPALSAFGAEARRRNQELLLKETQRQTELLRRAVDQPGLNTVRVL